MTDCIISHLANLRTLFSEAQPSDPKVISDYAWTIIKALLQHGEEIDSFTARQLLVDCLKLPIERPSVLYSALLTAALKVSSIYPEFRFATFLRMWDITNLRPEDAKRQTSQDGKSFPSLRERTAKTLAHSFLIHPETADSLSSLPILGDSGYGSFLAENGRILLPMLVTRIKEAVGKDGRKYRFVTLTSPAGLEVETISHTLQLSPLCTLPKDKRHYVNIGQLYNCLLRTKQEPSMTDSALCNSNSGQKSSSKAMHLTAAILSQLRPADFYQQEVGYIESIDTTHGHMHIYDTHSRHFVAPVQRFSREKAGDFVRFFPIVPQASKFKTAINVAIVPSSSPEVQSCLREIRITSVNREKGYAAWELTDKTHPITEQLSPLLLSQGETSPVFTTGYLNLPKASESLALTSSSTPILKSLLAGLTPGQILSALIYLKRGKDRQKRPHIARIFS